MKHYALLAGKYILLFSMLVSMWGCTTVNHKVGEALNLDTDLKLELFVDEEINPDENNQSSPVFIRLYELNSPKAFEKADFIDIYERDEEVLGDTFVKKQELKRVVPGTYRKERFVLSKDTRYVALFAEFYNYKDSKAKLHFAVTSSNVIRNAIKISVDGNKILLGKKN
ncbi:type VI secretion system lipoprotein TssJ [Agarilytica rhodophyticola]|uniref:type VI secretion system lipoprotein TssJ n=1 Tax=Agarilytica rhodophyticola TaxID=1737490 RepID=UPI000B342977|nr:type VI secretion system lipoprotein TssJ [Agarilytica rhodophyticola]